MNETPRLVHFGRGGHTIYYASVKTAYGTSSSKLSGYDSPETPQDVPDGTPVVDVRQAVETEAGFHWVFQGPLVDVDLEDGQISACPEPSSVLVAGLAAQDDKTYAGLLALHTANKGKEPGPLDSVPVSLYLAGWREHGARVGVYRDGLPVWQ